MSFGLQADAKLRQQHAQVILGRVARFAPERGQQLLGRNQLVHPLQKIVEEFRFQRPLAEIGIVDLLHNTAYTSPDGAKEGSPGEIPAELADEVEQYRTQLLDSVVETDEALMERYLDGQELSPEEVASALKAAVTRGELFPVACGVATKNLGTTAVLDLLVEGVPSPAKKGAPIEIEGAADAVFVFKTVADPFAGRINVFRVISGQVASDSNLVNPRTKGKERFGQVLLLQGKEHAPADGLATGDIGAVAKLKDVVMSKH